MEAAAITPKTACIPHILLFHLLSILGSNISTPELHFGQQLFTPKLTKNTHFAQPTAHINQPKCRKYSSIQTSFYLFLDLLPWQQQSHGSKEKKAAASFSQKAKKTDKNASSCKHSLGSNEGEDRWREMKMASPFACGAAGKGKRKKWRKKKNGLCGANEEPATNP